MSGALEEILEEYDDEKLSTLQSRHVLSRSETISQLCTFSKAQRPEFSPLECGILTSILLFPPQTSLSLVSSLDHWRSRQELIAALSSLEMRLFVLVKDGHLVPNPDWRDEIANHCGLSTLLAQGTCLGFDGFAMDTEAMRGLLSIIDQQGTLPEKSPMPACDEERWKELRKECKEVFLSLGLLSPEGKVSYSRFEELASKGTRKALSLCLEAASGISHEAWCQLLRILQLQGTVDTVSLKTLCKSFGIKPSRRNWKLLKRWGIPISREPRTKLVVDSDLTISYEGTSSPDDILWRFASLQKLEHTSTYQVTMRSLFRGLDGGLTVESILAYLREQTEGNTPQRLTQTIKLFAEQYQSVRLTHGIILEVDGRIRNLVEGIPEIRNSVLSRHGEGVYVMDGRTYPAWRGALSQAIGFTPTLQGEPLPPFREKPSPSPLPDWDEKEMTMGKEPLLPANKKDGDDAPMIAKADGFDYQAKTALIKHHLDDGPGLFLELECGEGTLLARPKALVKSSNGEAILQAGIEPSGETRNIPVRAIYRLAVRHWPLF